MNSLFSSKRLAKNRRGQQEMVGEINSFEKRLAKNRRGQQEMVGFVLIIVLVVVAMMVFLVISIKNSSKASEIEGVRVKHMLDAIMAYTTECAFRFEPEFASIEELFKGIYEARRCNNLGVSAQEHLNSSLINILNTLTKGEATINSYSINFVERSENSEINQFSLVKGQCTGLVESAQRNLLLGNTRLIVRLKICRS